ncbi:ABC transporter ATP-binding protein [Pararhizobium haloflavum]|uniref:ABC transporter ATP-binding protein n=1 Tax=Pararhizobium haloflavum TaxID=2037914 RepID=UPI001FDF9E47|nr:ABC transporter ATP-binding protein [Pararhizobium haloflavum]
MQADAAPKLEINDLSKRFGGLLAVDRYNLVLRQADLVGLIGPNGAGKTTAFNLATGILRPTAGRIRIAGRDLTGARPHVIAKAGLARTFQNIRLFADLTVAENIMCGGHARHAAGTVSTLLQLPSFWRAEQTLRNEAYRLIESLDLGALAARRAGDLSYGDQRRVEIGRALATQPDVLLLDEPAAGLNPSETSELMAFIRKVNETLGIAILVVEHDMSLIMGLCQRLQVLNRGALIFEGAPQQAQTNEAVIEAYLGTRRRAKANA